jgi:methane monooxygenase component A alpha chain/propane monooxygenase large subunit
MRAWNLTSADQETTPKHEPRYKLPCKGRDPLRMLVREYAKTESDKGDRAYSLLDHAQRMRMADQIQPRFMEALKLTLPDLTNAQYQTASGCGRIIASVGNQELRRGFHVQMLDEIRHTRREMALRRFYANSWQDPAGWRLSQKALDRHPGGLISSGLFENFTTGDLLDCVVNLNAIVETAFTSSLLDCTPQQAALNGDHAMAETFRSIQSDEPRHLATGYGSVMMMLAQEDNVPLLNESLERCFWQTHRGLDALQSWQAEYGGTVRTRPYRDQWQEWVVEDFVGNYIDKLTDLGVQPPARLDAAAESVRWMPHTLGQTFALLWPLNFWRSDAMGPEDFEYFERNNPGWYTEYGPFWDAYRDMAPRSSARIMLQELESLPPFCQVCQLPCVLPRIDDSEMRIVEHGGRRFALCSEGCEWIFGRWPQAYSERPRFWERYDGWELADVVLDLGYVRPDGRTLIGQPTVDLEPGEIWTIDDLRRVQYEVKDPLP